MTISQTHDLLLYAYDSVLIFWKSFKLPYAKNWIDATMTGRRLAANLMEEELSETLNAATKEAQLDGLCDLLYVTMGAMHACGFPASYLMLTSSTNFTGPLAESIKYLRAEEILCRRAHDSIPQACFGIADAAGRKFPLFAKAFKTVHEANMTKLWDSPSDNPDHTSEPTLGNKFIVRRKSDKKIMKPLTFNHPDLSPYVN